MDEAVVWLETGRPIHCFLFNDTLLCTTEIKSPPDSDNQKPKSRVDYLFSFALADILSPHLLLLLPKSL